MSLIPNHLLIKAINHEPIDRTPIWVMRQAGRYLPEYIKLKNKAGGFINLIKNPELACEITMQPLNRFSLDSAIVFSDILVVSEMLGINLSFVENKGPVFDKTITTQSDLESLEVLDDITKLNYVFQTIKLIKKELNNKKPDFYKIFRPQLTPKEMLELGVFGGSYFGLNVKEYPKIWFKNVKISKTFDVNLNRFKVVSGLSREHWIEKGWIFKEDPLGWFQWYCRYTNGRRIPHIDEIQIKRWKNFRRHVLAIEKNCEKGDLGCRKRQRQAILQWAYDPYR